jgi:Tfp pilus assembly protein PilV
MTQEARAARARGVLIALFLVVAGLLGYAIRQHYQVNSLTAENNAVVSNLKDTRAQVAALTAKIDSLSTPQQVAQAAEPVKEQTAKPRRKVIVRRGANDARFKRMQNQLDEQGRAIESTRQDLSSAKTELAGGIARTHEEVVALQKKGERNYFEFDLEKSKQFQRTGPVALSLRKANTKHMFADLEIRVEDAQVSQKHVNLFQPVMFYTSEQGRPVEMVINNVSKNHIHGYISAPKYSAAELAANSAENTNNNVSASKARQKLEVPKSSN